MDSCNHCRGYGYVQVYASGVKRVYCDCEAGDKRIHDLKCALAKEGLDPENPDYQWPRRSEYYPPKYKST